MQLISQPVQIIMGKRCKSLPNGWHIYTIFYVTSLDFFGVSGCSTTLCILIQYHLPLPEMPLIQVSTGWVEKVVECFWLARRQNILDPRGTNLRHCLFFSLLWCCFLGNCLLFVLRLNSTVSNVFTLLSVIGHWPR